MTLTNQTLDKWVEDLQDEIDENWTHGAVGTDDTEPDPSHEELFAEVLRKERQDITEEFGKTTLSFWISSLEANGETLKEFGFFDDDTEGEMKVREIFDGIDKSSEIELWFDVNVTVSTEEV